MIIRNISMGGKYYKKKYLKQKKNIGVLRRSALVEKHLMNKL